MAKGRIRLISTIPGPSNLGPIVREFCKKEGVVTALSDSAVRMLAELLPEESGCEPMAFGGLVRRFASYCGEMPLPVAHEGHVVAAIGAACEELTSDSPFGRVAARQGLHKALAETLHEMSGFGIDPDAYESLAEKCDPIYAPKLRSLAQIERQASDTLRQLGRSLSREHFRLCQDSSPERGADLGDVLLLAGGEFRPQAIELLQWAASQGARITVVVYRHNSETTLFRGARLTAGMLGLEAEMAGEANQLLTHLFAPDCAEIPDVRCSIVSAADPLAEAEWALRGCLQRHHDGTHYNRMALYVRDSAAYAPLIEASAKRLGIPLRMWRRAPLLTNSFARLTLAALNFCASDDVRSLMPLARTTYVSLDFETRTAVQSVLRSAHSKRTEQWRALREWVVEQSEKFDWLAKLLDWRDEAISNPAPLEVWIGRLREMMMALPGDHAPGRQGAMSEARSERDKRAWYVLQQSLNQVASVHRLQGPRSIGIREFAQYAANLWSESDVSVPSGENGVLVTSQAEALPEVHCLFVIGMLEGIFPRRRSEDPILSDFERQAMSELRGGIPLPTSRDRAEAERDEFYAVCAAASEEIVFSYPETDEERDNVPAFYLDEVERALGGVDRLTRAREALTPELADCLALSDREIQSALASPDRAESLPLAFANPFTVQALARDPELGLKPRELREAMRCPFSFFARRILDIRPERLRARWFSLVQLPQAAELSAQVSPEAARLSLESELDVQLDGLYSDVPEWEISLLRSGGRRLIGDWVDREFAARKIWPKEDVRAPAKFGDEGLRSTLPNIVKLSGKVAGLSKAGPYSVVHLVETTSPAKGFGGDLVDPDKLYFGIHLLAAWSKESRSALEIETMGGERTLVLLPRVAGANFHARVQDGLKVMDLGGGEDSGGERAFFDDVKRLAREAAKRIEAVDVRAIRGEHCMWCDYGELCRSSLEFGEEDSPFVDEV